MLNVRNLDDQTYAQIVETAEGRLPWLCPAWTNHNAGDPGITIIELMAWYKELQQYHLNKLTDALKLKLLKLAGMAPRAASPARCGLYLGPSRHSRPALERLFTREGIPFELSEPVPEERPRIEKIPLASGGRSADVTALARDKRVAFTPFLLDGERAKLRIGFSALGRDRLRLWFDVARPSGVARNPFEDGLYEPRTIRWRCAGASATRVERDDTHSLSLSGWVTLAPEGVWPAGEEGLYWLELELTRPGCEEEVRLEAVYEDLYEAVQRETLASAHYFTVTPGPDTELTIDDAQARDSIPVVFFRTKSGWDETEDWIPERGRGGIKIKLDTGNAVSDGKDNMLVVCLDSDLAPELLFDARGVPGETFCLRLEGRTALRERLSLLCNTLMEDGSVSPALWRCVDDLLGCGPRDRVFTYDEIRETVTFGDGEHGALLMGGHGAVLAAELTVTGCDGGNIPEDAQLWFAGDGESAAHTAASGGVNRESVAETEARLLRKLDTTKKCASRADYERLAASTPGLRVARACAIPGFDPADPTGTARSPVVTVVVVPAGSGAKPMPDKAFLEAVRARLDSLRPIGVKVCVAAPEYIDIDVSLTLRGGDAGMAEELEERVREYLSGRVSVGGTVYAGDISAIAQAAPGVLQVRAVSIRTPNAGCVQTGEGDIRLPRRGLACLRSLRLSRQSVERRGE